MQFQTIIAVLSLAFVATAVPTGSTTTKTTTVAKCNQSGGNLQCCNGKGTGGTGTTSGGLLGLTLPINLDLLQCGIPIINILSFSGCNSGQALNCCDQKGGNGINILSNNCLAIGSV